MHTPFTPPADGLRGEVLTSRIWVDGVRETLPGKALPSAAGSGGNAGLKRGSLLRERVFVRGRWMPGLTWHVQLSNGECVE